jgi:ABC-type maltose transport system permease subunit
MENKENKKGLSFVLMIPAIIIGVALYEQFDFENLKFEKPALAIVYIVGIALSIILQVKAFKKQAGK